MGIEGSAMKTAIIALIVISALSQAAHAEDTVPSELIIGYDNEVNLSTPVCATLRKPITIAFSHLAICADMRHLTPAGGVFGCV
jgi:hypothetical protein